MKRYVIPFIIGIILIGVGSCSLFFEILSFEEATYERIPKELVTETVSYPITETTHYNIQKVTRKQELSVVFDDALGDSMKVIVTYDKFLGDFNSNRYQYGKTEQKEPIYSLQFKIDYENRLLPVKEALSILKEMVRNKVYYTNVIEEFLPTIEIRVSEKYKDNIMIDHDPITAFERMSDESYAS